MDEFLEKLAERKHNLYHALYVAKPQAYTNEECLERIEKKAKYEEVVEIIHSLPYHQQQIVKNYYNELNILTLYS